MRREGLILPAVLLAAFALVPTPGRAQPQTTDQQACTNAMNQSLLRVSVAVGKDVAACIKDGAKGELASIEDCAAADRKGKVGKARDKTDDSFGKRCTGVSARPPGAPRKPPYGVTDASSVNDAAGNGVTALLSDLFGPELDGSIVLQEDDSDAAACQQSVAKSTSLCRDTKLKEFNGCKKSRLKDEASPVDDATDLEACLGVDPKGKIAKSCDLREEQRPGRFKVDGIRKALDKKCAAKGVRLAEALPGCAQNDAEAAHACLDRAVECRACLAVNQADGLARDCDLFDDGQDNTSCPPLLVGAHTCTLDEEQSGFLFDSAAGFLLGSLAGSLRLSCANADPATGEGSCSCAIEEIAPVAVPGTGWACIAPVDGCSRGTIACNGGRSLDYALVADHVIGTCTGNQDCATQCAALCDASSARVFDSGCEGFCEGGARDSLACTGDGQCSGGSCNGAASNAHGNVCQCQCIEDDGEESREGGLRCDLGVGIRIERNLPCDGADVLMDLGSRCVPFTTEESFAILHDQDAEPGADLPAGGENLFGEPVACSTFAAGGPAGLVLGSVVNTFDVARVGDVHMLLALVCE